MIIFAMWVLRRLEKIGWIDKVTNAGVLRLVQENRNILNTVNTQQQKLRSWIGHWAHFET